MAHRLGMRCVSLDQRYLKCDTHPAVRAVKVANVSSCQTTYHKQQQQIGLLGISAAIH